MTLEDVYAEIRDLLGGVDEKTVADRSLRRHLEAGMEWLTQELRTAVEEDTTTYQAETGRQEYPLLAHVNQIKWVSHNGVPLDPMTTDQWRGDGTDWTMMQAGYPSEYAVEGRKLIFNCPFSAAAVASDAVIRMKYNRSFRGLRPASIPEIPDSDVRLAIVYAARRWCLANLHLDGNSARAGGLQTMIQEGLSAARFRNAQTIEDQQPSQRVHTGRAYAAR